MGRMSLTSSLQINKSGSRHQYRKQTTNMTSAPQASLTLHSGPKRYDYSEQKDDWLYSRDGVTLSDLLDSEISQIVGRKVELGVQNVSEHIG